MDIERAIAIDIAVLPPADVSARAVALSAALPEHHSRGLRLGPDRLPHVTLTQQFVNAEALNAVCDRVGPVLDSSQALTLRVTGAERRDETIWLAIERTAPILALHERLMDAVRALERSDGGRAAFVDGDARDRDVAWVAGYRTRSAFAAFLPHITLGHGDAAPEVEPFEFTATTVALCHLGRFCTCREVLRQWRLGR